MSYADPMLAQFGRRFRCGFCLRALVGRRGGRFLRQGRWPSQQRQYRGRAGRQPPSRNSLSAATARCWNAESGQRRRFGGHLILDLAVSRQEEANAFWHQAAMATRAASSTERAVYASVYLPENPPVDPPHSATRVNSACRMTATGCRPGRPPALDAELWRRNILPRCRVRGHFFLAGSLPFSPASGSLQPGFLEALTSLTQLLRLTHPILPAQAETLPVRSVAAGCLFRAIGGGREQCQHATPSRLSSSLG